MSLSTTFVGALMGGVGSVAATIAAGAALRAASDARASRRILTGEDAVETDDGLVGDVETLQETARAAEREAARAHRRLDDVAEDGS